MPGVVHTSLSEVCDQLERVLSKRATADHVKSRSMCNVKTGPYLARILQLKHTAAMALEIIEFSNRLRMVGHMDHPW